MIQLIPCSILPPSTRQVNKNLSKFLSPWVILANDVEYLGLGKLEETVAGPRWKLQDGRLIEFEEVTAWGHLTAVGAYRPATPVAPLLTDEGYPSSYALSLLQTWHWADEEGWFRIAEAVWSHSGTHFKKNVEADKTIYVLGTAGWSGNEAAIEYMRKNELLWAYHWVESHRGGWHTFEVAHNND